MTSLNGTESLASRLAAAEACRDRLAQRAAGAEAEAARLRQQLLTFSDELASAAREQDASAVVSTASSSAAPPNPRDRANDVVPSVALPRPGVDANVALAVASPVVLAPPLGPSAPPLGPSAPLGPGSEENGSTEGRPSKRPKRVSVFNPKWRNGRDWLEYDAKTCVPLSKENMF